MEPERPRWTTTLGWAAALAGCALFGLLFFRGSAAADRRAATAKAEVAREEEHMNRVIAWMEDTVANAPIPGGAGRPTPTTDRAKRLWVISRMLEDEWTWSRGILERHGVGPDGTPDAWGTGRYQGNARAHPEVGRYLEARVTAFAEIEKSSAAWMEARTESLARESGMSAWEIRDMFARDFAGVDWDEERVAEAMLEMHRHLVRVDPRVQYDAGADRLLFDREDDLRRADELETKLNDAVAYWKQAQDRRVAEGIASLAREID